MENKNRDLIERNVGLWEWVDVSSGVEKGHDLFLVNASEGREADLRCHSFRLVLILIIV